MTEPAAEECLVCSFLSTWQFKIELLQKGTCFHWRGAGVGLCLEYSQLKWDEYVVPALHIKTQEKSSQEDSHAVPLFLPLPLLSLFIQFLSLLAKKKRKKVHSLCCRSAKPDAVQCNPPPSLHHLHQDVGASFTQPPSVWRKSSP